MKLVNLMRFFFKAPIDLRPIKFIKRSGLQGYKMVESNLKGDIKNNIEICVIGDLMLDKFIYGSVERISPEAPVPILRAIKEEYKLGGAANVANNIRSLGENVALIGILGNRDHDYHREIFKRLVEQKDIEFKPIFDSRPTIVKNRFIDEASKNQTYRVDYEETHHLENGSLDEIIDYVKDNNFKYIIVSDYNKGLINSYFMDNLKKLDAKILVDPKPENIGLYKGVYLIKPNLKEAREIYRNFALNSIKTNDFEEMGRSLVKEYDANFIITRGEKGSSLFYKADDGNIYTYHKPQETIEVFDVTGAGDTYIAALTSGLNKGFDLRLAMDFAGDASKLVVQKVGTAVVTLKEIKDFNNHLDNKREYLKYL